MKEAAIAARYSQAFFEQAQEAGQIDQVNDNMLFLKDLVKKSTEFQYLIHEPTLELAKRVKILETTFKDQLTPLTLQFLSFLSEKRRLSFLSFIIEEWERIYLTAKNILRVKMTSATEVSQKIQHEVIDRLSKKLKKNIELNIVIDRNLLGGFKIQVGDTVYDHSFSYQLEKIKQQYLFT